VTLQPNTQTDTSTTHISTPTLQHHISDSKPPSNSLKHRNASRTNSKDISRYRRKTDLHLPKFESTITNSRLCDLCSKIRFDRVTNTTREALQSRRGRKEGVPIASLRTRRHKKPITDCPLCHLLYTYVDRSGHKQKHYQLHAFSYIQASKTINYTACDNKVRRADILCLKIPHTELQEYIFCLRKEDRHDHIFTPRKLKPKVSLAICKEWLGHCQENNRVCNHIGSLPSHLRVVDCQSFKIIVAPPQEPYVALDPLVKLIRVVSLGQPGTRSR
jgi:hypothetical protein